MTINARTALAFLCTAGIMLAIIACTPADHADPLPSWNDTKAKMGLLSFVARVTDPDSSDFVARSERIAVFDNDGTLWSERPVYYQAFFVFDRIKILAPNHPNWKNQEPFASVLRGDLRSALAGGEKTCHATRIV